MRSSVLRSEGMLLVSSVIWGFAFVAQRAGMDHVGPFIFNSVRFALGAAAVIPFAILSARKSRVPGTARPAAERAGTIRLAAAGGSISGMILFAGASLQQIGIVYTTAGKAGFITGLYVVLVPVMGLAVGRRTGVGTWLGVVLAAAGLYLLSFSGGFTMEKGDFLVVLCTFFWALHVLVIGHYTLKVDPLSLSAIQFIICSAMSLAASLIFETTGIEGLRAAAIPILFGGLLSVGIAYTLQAVAQRKAPPSHAAVILSLETVFAAIGGRLILSETIPARGIAGCALMLAGIIASQIGVRMEKGRGIAPA